MSDKETTEVQGADALLAAAKQVIECWEGGDLAAAVRGLNEAVNEFETENTPPDMLPRHTLKCPKDGKRLHFEQISGMRVKRAHNEKQWYYSAYCPTCNANYRIDARQGYSR